MSTTHYTLEFIMRNKYNILKKDLKKLILENKTEKEIASIYNCSPSIVEYYKKKYSLQTSDLKPDDAKNRLKDKILECKICNKKSNIKTCSTCKSMIAQIAKKELLVDMFGGCCQNCGYSKCLAGLDFHHIDPNSKTFDISRNYLNRSIDEIILEAKKCIILCSNCHRELHSTAKEKMRLLVRERIDKTKVNMLRSIGRGSSLRHTSFEVNDKILKELIMEKSKVLF